MSEPFDPYHKWLGIPPKDQPPTHYRLLAVEPFESDLDVIENAADQRMRHVRSFQGGANQALSQKLLNEIAAARVCLLNPATKSAYDAQLTAAPAYEPAPILPQPAPVAPAPHAAPTSAPALRPILAPSPRVEASAPAITPATPRRRSGKDPLMEVVKVVLGGAAGLGLAFLLLSFFKPGWDILGIAGAVRGDGKAPVAAKSDPDFVPPPRIAPSPQRPPPTPKPALVGKQPTVPPSTASPPQVESPLPMPATPPAVPAAPAPLPPLVGQVEVVDTTWMRGESDKVLMPVKDAFVVPTWISGEFLGGGEGFQLKISANSEYVLHGYGIKPVGFSASCVRTPYRAWFEEEVESFNWKNGNEPIRLIHEHDGFAVLAGVRGPFQGIPDAIQVVINPDDGMWELRGSGGAAEGWALVYRFKQPGRFRAQLTELGWPGSESKPLLSVTDGLGYISCIIGRYCGLGENLYAHVHQDGRWRAWGNTLQPGTDGKFTTIQFNTPAMLALAPTPPNVQWVDPFKPSQSSAAATIGKRLAIPSAEQVAIVKGQIAERLKPAFEAAKTADQKLALATQLLADAGKASDAQSQFASFVVARDMAAAAGDWETCLQAITALAAIFDVEAYAAADEIRPKIDALGSSQRNPQAVFLRMMDLTEAAVAQDRYDIAERLTKSAQKITQQARDLQTTRQLADYAAELRKRARKYELIKPHLELLTIDPGDSTSNLAVGKFRCFDQHRWELGLPLLALGDDKELAQIAAKERMPPTDLAGRLALANDWWALADARPTERKLLRRRAINWYLQCHAPAEGETKSLVQSRLTEDEKWHSKDATYAVYGKPSQNDEKFPPLPSLLSSDTKFHFYLNEFAFCISDRKAFIVIDLKQETAISRLQILNRQGKAAATAKGMTAYLSLSPGFRGEAIWIAPDFADEWNVYLPRVFVGRYLVLARDPEVMVDAPHFHLRKVRVFGPE